MDDEENIRKYVVNKKNITIKDDESDQKLITKKNNTKKIILHDHKIKKPKNYFIFYFALLMVSSLLGGNFLAQYTYIEKENNLFGLYVTNSNSKLPDTLKIVSENNFKLTIKNENSFPVTLNFIIWGWSPPATYKQVTLKWDYDGAPIPPGIARDIHFFIESNDEISEKYCFNVNILAFKSWLN